MDSKSSFESVRLNMQPECVHMLELCVADLPVQMHVSDCGSLCVMKLLDPVQPLVDSVSHLVQLHIQR